MLIEDYEVEENEESSQISDISEEIVGGIRRVCCTVDVPEELYEDQDDEVNLRADYAIYVAREQLPDRCIPAEWTTVFSTRNAVRVRRESRAL